MLGEMVRVEFGSGDNPDPDYDVHTDIDPDYPVDFVLDASKSLPFDDSSVDAIKAVDILEHISYQNTLDVLKEWNRVLKPGGELYVQVPEAGVAITNFVNNPKQQVVDRFKGYPPIVSLAWRLLGGHFDMEYVKNEEHWRYNAHYALFDSDSLRWYLNRSGFVVVRMEINSHPNILCWAAKR
jgi:predicted SAM-dependent methyltransferase